MTNWTVVKFRLNFGTRFCLGICKNCGDVDTIFGTWSIVHPAKDCRDLQMAIETKRDIFRKETVHTRKQEKLSKIKSKF